MTSSLPGSSWLRQTAPWICVGGTATYVLVSPLLLGESNDWWLWLLIGALALGLVVAGAVLSVKASRRHLAEIRRLEHDRRNLEALSETRHVALQSLVEQQLPAALQGAPVPPLPVVAGDDVAAGLLDRATMMLAGAPDQQHAQQEAMEAAVVALGRKVQASAHRIQEEAARMVHRHPADADVLQTSMRVDHAAAQQARQAQTLATLCGEPPGQQWHQPLPLAEVVRGAAGRITAYQRVEVLGDPAVAVSARAVEPLIHVVAELLANATQCSPPTTQVLVSLRHVQRGAVVEIDDCGVGLDDNRLEQVREIASGRRPVSLVELGEIPQTGLPVVGIYVRRHGFRVDITESVYGGLRAVVLVPSDLTEAVAPTGTITQGGHALVRRAEAQTSAAEQTTGRVHPSAAVPTITANTATTDFPALPQRRSRRGDASSVTTVNRSREGEPGQTAEQAGQWMGAFLNTGAPNEQRTNPPADANGTPEER